MKRRRNRYDADDGDQIVADGTTLHVPLMLCDSLQRDVYRRYHRTALADQIAEDALCWSGHRPGPIADGVRLNARDAGANYAALTARAESFANLCRRSARAYIDGPAVSKPLTQGLPEDNWDLRQPLDPVDITNGNGDDENGDDDGNGNGDRRRINLAEAQAAREASYRSQYTREPWRDMNGTMPSPNTGMANTLSNYGGRQDPRGAASYSMGPGAGSGELDPNKQSAIERQYEATLGRWGGP
jgi:hypothetical protein